jgi:hypothetical protein
VSPLFCLFFYFSSLELVVGPAMLIGAWGAINTRSMSIAGSEDRDADIRQPTRVGSDFSEAVLTVGWITDNA